MAGCGASCLNEGSMIRGKESGPMNKPADTKYEILQPIRERWSPRAFAPRSVPAEDLRRLFEAARWAASSFNEQPWRFIVARREDETGFRKMLECLMEGNRTWAKNAGVLVLTATAGKFRKNDKPNRVALHDLGQAAAHLALQATAMGLFVHQMAGIDRGRIRETYDIPDGFDPQTGIAIGYAGSVDDLPENFQGPEKSERSRKPQSEFVFGSTWGQAADW
jgi:nitroreductase